VSQKRRAFRDESPDAHDDAIDVALAIPEPIDTGVLDFQCLAITLLASTMVCWAAWAQPSPTIPGPAPLLGLDGRDVLGGAFLSTPIADERGDAASYSAEGVKSLDPPRPPVDPGLLR
jgi:hypothetical protein